MSARPRRCFRRRTAPGQRVFGPVEFAMTRSGLVGVVRRVGAVISACAQVKVGIQAAGHYHRPVLDYRWPAGWEVLEFNPAHVAEQRRVQGRRRVKTDAIDLEAITELLLAGRGRLITDREVLIGEVAAWAIHRSRRVATRSATKNQTARSTRPRVSGVDAGVARCAGHQDRSASRRLARRRVRRPGPAVRAGCKTRLIRFAAARDIQLRRGIAERLGRRPETPCRPAMVPWRCAAP